MAYSDFYNQTVSQLADITDNVTASDEGYWEATGAGGHAYQQIKDLYDELGSDPKGSYADVATRLTAANLLTEIKTVDGAGSGLDADLLDAQSGAYYLDSANFTGTNWTDLTDAGATTLHKHDHGGLDGLGDDDHTQYILASGTRALTGDWTAGSFTITVEEINVDTITNAGAMTISPTGDINLNPGGDDVLPTSNYDINLGSISKKYLTLHAAELWVETLVAQDTLATIGGRVLIAPTTTLIADLAAVDTTFDVKHNNLANGDRVVMEANGNLEWIAIASVATTITGGYRYTITRNLDGSGANQWYAGDAVLNTGTTGDGFIDLYSIDGVTPGSTAGPTIVGNVRNSGTYNDYNQYFAIGNLNGLYSYSSDTYGLGLGNTGDNHITIDTTNGIRFYDSGAVLRAQLNSNILTLGNTTNEHVIIESSRFLIKNGVAVHTELEAGILRLGIQTAEHLNIDATNGLRFYDQDGSTIRAQLSGSNWNLGNTGAEHINIEPTKLEFKDGSTVYTTLEAGVLTLGNTSNDLYIDVESGRVHIQDGTNTFFYVDVATVVGTTSVFAQDLGGTSYFDVALNASSATITSGTTNNADSATVAVLSEGSGLVGVRSDISNNLGARDPAFKLLTGASDERWHLYIDVSDSYKLKEDRSNSGGSAITLSETTDFANRLIERTIDPENITAGTKYTDYFDDVQTTDATATTVRTIATSANIAYHAIVTVTARQTGGAAVDDVAAYRHVALARQKSGTLAIAASTNDWTLEDDSTWQVSTSVSGNNLLIRVHGDGSDNVDWTVHTRVYETST